MGPYPSARRWVARLSSGGAVAALACACNALLGTPEPELAPDAGPDAGVDAAAGDATTKDATGQDSAATDGGPAESGPGDTGAADATPAEAGPPSCQGDGGPGVTVCGAAGDGCCNSFLVPGGTYARAFTTASDGGATGLDASATVSSFRLDEFEVTVGRFRRFVAATRAGWTPAPGSGIHTELNGGMGLQQPTGQGGTFYETGWSAAWNASMSQADGGGAGFWDGELSSCQAPTWTPSAGTQEDLPINCVNWYEAYAFCIWDGGFLPSSAEWELAAAGGAGQREYPWGATDPGFDDQYAIYDCAYPDGGVPDGGFTCGSTSNIAPVGSAPLGAGLWQQLDLAGNVHEPNLDWGDSPTTYVTPCVDCADLTPAGFRVATGGSWVVNVGALVTTYRAFYAPASRDMKGGIRCARAP